MSSTVQMLYFTCQMQQLDPRVHALTCDVNKHSTASCHWFKRCHVSHMKNLRRINSLGKVGKFMVPQSRAFKQTSAVVEQKPACVKGSSVPASQQAPQKAHKLALYVLPPLYPGNRAALCCVCPNAHQLVLRGLVEKDVYPSSAITIEFVVTFLVKFVLSSFLQLWEK